MAKIGDIGLGFGTGTGEIPAAPAAPKIVSVATGADSLTATLTGDAGVLHTVYVQSAAGRSVGGTRTGNGTVIIADVTPGLYLLQAQSSVDGVLGLSSNIVSAVVAPSVLTGIEVWAVGLLTALTDDAGNPLFNNTESVDGVIASKAVGERCVDHWSGQIELKNSGLESFDRLAPFAFVRASIGRVEREGGYAANNRIMLDITCGQSDKAGPIARCGSATKPGLNRIFEKIFLAFDGAHPGSGIACDPFFLDDTTPTVEQPTRSGIQLHFEANWIASNS